MVSVQDIRIPLGEFKMLKEWSEDLVGRIQINPKFVEADKGKFVRYCVRYDCVNKNEDQEIGDADPFIQFHFHIEAGVNVDGKMDESQIVNETLNTIWPYIRHFVVEGANKMRIPFISFPASPQQIELTL